MKIGIITFHRAENYGSVLQAYALNAYIREVMPEADVEEIDYESEVQRSLYRILDKPNSLLGFARFLHSFFYYKQLLDKKRKFSDFIDKYIPLSTIHGDISSDTLKKYALKYDILICGSDQIWNIHCADSNDFYFLSFASETTKKVAYAPSLGLTHFTREEKDILKERTKTFNFLSAREDNGASILSSLTGKKVEVVCDPVLLFSSQFWRVLSRKVKSVESPYILCYFIGNIPGMRQFVKRVKRETGISKVIVIMKNLRDIGSGYTTRFDAGPIDFLNLIDNASYVITDSFHATCFSLLFHTKFWVFVEPNSNLKPNSRIFNILKVVNCQDRILSIENMENVDVCADINYDMSDINIENFSLYSKKYLTKVLL